MGHLVVVLPGRGENLRKMLGMDDFFDSGAGESEGLLRDGLCEQGFAVLVDEFEQELFPFELHVGEPFDGFVVKELALICWCEFEALACFRSGAADDEMRIGAIGIAAFVDELEVVVMAGHEDICVAINRFLEGEQPGQTEELIVPEMFS